jgi:hypothetical protein
LQFILRDIPYNVREQDNILHNNELERCSPYKDRFEQRRAAERRRRSAQSAVLLPVF